MDLPSAAPGRTGKKAGTCMHHRAMANENRYYIRIDGIYCAHCVALITRTLSAMDGVHSAFNTCQNCTPSPKAFYTQEGDVLKCENCGFTFAAEEVGIVHGGCNPWPIDGVEITADTVVIPAAALDAMKASFARWGGPVK